MYSQEVQNQAVDLRVSRRLTIPEIQRRLGVAKSTLSLWLRPYPLTSEELKGHRVANVQKARLGKIDANQPPRGLVGAWESRPNLSKADLGEACRQMICAKLMLAGIQVFRPLNEDTPIDLVVLGSATFLRCQCKCVFRGSGKPNHTISFSSVRKWGPNSQALKHNYTREEVDFFLGYCPDNDGVYVIPYADTRGRSYASIWVTSSPLIKNQVCEFNSRLNAFRLLTL